MLLLVFARYSCVAVENKEFQLLDIALAEMIVADDLGGEHKGAPLNRRGATEVHNHCRKKFGNILHREVLTSGGRPEFLAIISPYLYVHVIGNLLGWQFAELRNELRDRKPAMAHTIPPADYLDKGNIHGACYKQTIKRVCLDA